MPCKGCEKECKCTAEKCDERCKCDKGNKCQCNDTVKEGATTVTSGVAAKSCCKKAEPNK